MMKRRSRIRTLLVVGLLLVGVLALPGSPAPAVGTCVTPPTFVPVADLNPGDMAVGWTAVSGQTPVSFDVEILGVLDEGIAPDVDFVLIEVSGPVVEEFGGIASGMSGSPVYIGPDLVGAVSYGFTGGDHMIGGLTPAENMLDLLNYPESLQPALAVKVPLGPDLRSAMSEATGASIASTPGSAEQLPIPLAVSGLGRHGVEYLVKRFEKRDLPFSPYVAGKVMAPVSSAPLPGTQPAPGEPVAAMLSYGDVTWGGVGTQTATCGDLSVGFGHPLGWFGRTDMGMNEASVVKVVADTSGVWGPFKLANIGDAAGIIDQDRTAGIRGIADVDPVTVPVTTELDNAELGTHKSGRTDVVFQEFLPELAGSHLAQAIWSANDTGWDGTAKIGWVIEGLREDGSPFTVTHDDAYFDTYDVGWLASNYLWYDIFRLQNNDFEQISITSVSATGDVSEDRDTAKIRKVRSKTLVQPTLAERTTILVRKGRPITLNVELDPWGVAPPANEVFTITAPTKPGIYLVLVSGGMDVGAGGSYSYSYSYSYDAGDSPASFEELLESIGTGYSNTDLVVGIYPPEADDAVVPVSEIVRHETDIVEGFRLLQLRVTK